MIAGYGVTAEQSAAYILDPIINNNIRGFQILVGKQLDKIGGGPWRTCGLTMVPCFCSEKRMSYLTIVKGEELYRIYRRTPRKFWSHFALLQVMAATEQLS